MTLRHALLAGFLMTLSFAMGTVRAADPDTYAAMPDPAEKITTLDQWDAAMEFLRDIAWRSQAGGEADTFLKDDRGRSIADDLQQWVLVDATLARLASLHAEAGNASQAGNAAAVDAALREAAPLLEGALCATSMVNDYWSAWELAAHHRALIEAWLPKAPELVANMTRDSLREANAKVASVVPAAPMPASPDACAIRVADDLKLYLDIVKQLNEARAGLINALDALHAARPALQKSRDRQTPCPAPASRTSASPVPKISRSGVDLEEMYPPGERRMQVEGVARLKVRVSATGCMLSAEIDRSTGSDALDEAALLAAEWFEFFPAEVDGKAVEADYEFNMRFGLYD